MPCELDAWVHFALALPRMSTHGKLALSADRFLADAEKAAAQHRMGECGCYGFAYLGDFKAPERPSGARMRTARPLMSESEIGP